MNQNLLFAGVSAVVLLATSQVALAQSREPFKPSANSNAGTRVLLDRPNFTLTKPVLNQTKPNNPMGGGAVGQVGKPGGSLTGVGVPGGLNTGTGGRLTGVGVPGGISTGTGLGATGKGLSGVGGIKGANGQIKGVESRGSLGVSAGMIGAINTAKAGKGQEKGVQQGGQISERMAPSMIKMINDAAASRGQEKGVQSGGSTIHLTPGQRQQIISMQTDPKINPQLGAQDPKGDKGATPKPTGPKPTGDSKPAPKPGTGGGTTTEKKPTPKPGTGTGSPKPGGGTTAEKKPTPKPSTGGGKPGTPGGPSVVVTDKKTGAKVVGGKMVLFPDQKITPKPKPGPKGTDFSFVKPPKPPKVGLTQYRLAN